MSYRKIAQLRSPADLRRRLDELGVSMPMDDAPLSRAEGSPMADGAEVAGMRIGNRWCIHPMEGWDANPDGTPTELTLRRWQRFGLSGAKLIWGGEAAAVRPDGRANPHQTMALESTAGGLAMLRETLIAAHRDACGDGDDLVIGLQLTHSGRYCRPTRKDRAEPRIAYHHPLLDRRCGIDSGDASVVWTDAELEGLVEDYVRAARIAHAVGFDFVDVKACHGYLLHEFLSARRRPGPYGGDLLGRSRLLLEIIRAVQRECSGLAVGVRLSLFDFLPFEMGGGEDASDSVGRPMEYDASAPYDAGFGCDENDPLRIDLTEPLRLVGMLRDEGVRMLNLTCGSPYYNPHIQRPAIFPPSDGYGPPEDPLCGVARQIHAAAQVRRAYPDMFTVGSGYTYLQDYLPHVAQAVVREQMIDSVGLGRMVLSYPELPRDVLDGAPPRRKSICRTFSDCTSAPRQGMVSGCYPLDDFYKQRPERAALVALKQKDPEPMR